MTHKIRCKTVGPAVTIQDLGRPNHITQGLSQGGAADMVALFEASALLGKNRILPAFEMAGFGMTLTTSAPLRFALTGAMMQARIDDQPIEWNRTHRLMPNQTLSIGAVSAGTYGYFTPAGDILASNWLDSCSTHLLAGIGTMISAGDEFELAPDPEFHQPDQKISAPDRFGGGIIRMVAGPQTGLFDPKIIDKFLSTEFRRSPQANRQGVKCDCDAGPFKANMPSGLASEFIQIGDIQMTGQGVPYVLLGECQTIGGYPRIGTVIPADIPKVAQAPLGAPLRFEMITLDQADAAQAVHNTTIKALSKSTQPCIRNPHEIANLLAYNLIDGMITGTEDHIF